MKLKLFTLIFALAFSLSLAGCGEDAKKNNSDDMASDIKSDMQSAGDRLESGVQSAEDKIEDGMQSGESALESGMQSTDNGSNASSDAKISKDKAKKIALDDAKVKESEIKNYKIELDRDDQVLVYELEFDHDGYEYDYEIDANSGAIRERDKDRID